MWAAFSNEYLPALPTLAGVVASASESADDDLTTQAPGYAITSAGKGGAAPCVGTSCSAWCLVRSAAAGRTTPRGAAAGSTAAQA